MRRNFQSYTYLSLTNLTNIRRERRKNTNKKMYYDIFDSEKLIDMALLKTFIFDH